MVRDVVIVGGGTAGWLTAAYLARTLAANAPQGARITLIESTDIGILGVGEGTFPSVRKTLQRIGIDEAHFLRESNATFKQGIRFNHWQVAPGETGRDHYFHPFQSGHVPGELDLLPYWLQGCAGKGIAWDEVCSVQKAVADLAHAPKRLQDPAYSGPLNYAYHFDASRFANLLMWAGKELGVKHILDTIDVVQLDADGAVAGVQTRGHGTVKGDLYIDCSGFRAELIGKALNVPLVSCHDSLFCDRAVTLQIPYDRPDAPIASYTITTAQEAGWIWDIGLRDRRGIGHVYSADHTNDEQAERVLRQYIGPAADGKAVRPFKFDVGYRATPWVKNCVAVGLASGFFEPLEATGIVLTEVAAVMIANLFPWAGGLETAARQFNFAMTRRYERTLDFIKMHYCLSRRRDNAFWRDNADPATWPESLKELLDRWQHRPPDPMDFNPNYENFTDASWQFVLYGMGFKSDLSAGAGAFSHHDRARAKFQEIRQQSKLAIGSLPSHRFLIEQVHRRSA